jgi:hypothetical protein
MQCINSISFHERTTAWARFQPVLSDGGRIFKAKSTGFSWIFSTKSGWFFLQSSNKLKLWDTYNGKNDVLTHFLRMFIGKVILVP